MAAARFVDGDCAADMVRLPMPLPPAHTVAFDATPPAFICCRCHRFAMFRHEHACCCRYDIVRLIAAICFTVRCSTMLMLPPTPPLMLTVVTVLCFAL